MNRTQRGLILIAVLIVAALLAFPLRDAIYEPGCHPGRACRLEPPIVLSFGFTGHLVVGNHFSCDRHACHEPGAASAIPTRLSPKPKPPQGQVGGPGDMDAQSRKGYLFHVAGREPWKACLSNVAPPGERAPALGLCAAAGKRLGTAREVQQYLSRVCTGPLRIFRIREAALRLGSILRLIT